MKPSTIIAAVLGVGAAGSLLHKVYYGRWPWDRSPAAPAAQIGEPRWCVSAYDPARGESLYSCLGSSWEAQSLGQKFASDSSADAHVTVTDMSNNNVIYSFGS